MSAAIQLISVKNIIENNTINFFFFFSEKETSRKTFFEKTFFTYISFEILREQ